MKLNLGCSNKKLEGFTNIDYPEIDLNKTPYKYKQNSIDEINCEFVIEHLNITLEEFLKECHRILKRGGRLRISTDNFFHWRERLKFLTGNWQTMNNYARFHHLLMTPSDFIKICRRSGFAIIKYDYGNKFGKYYPNLLANKIDLILWRQSNL